MKILIFGASGSGTSTLGNSIQDKTDFIHLDVDDYYWKPTQPPFQEKVPLVHRNEQLRLDVIKHKNVVVSGSLVSWGEEWLTAFDLAIFLKMDPLKRMDRLKKRESDRYGELLFSDEKIKQTSTAFLAWAKEYDNPQFEGRSLRIHIEWMSLLKCKVFQLDGASKLGDKLGKVLAEIKNSE